MKVLKSVLVTVGVTVVLAILVAGYFGFIPGLSNLFGSNRPSSLGIAYNSDDATSANSKIAFQWDPAPGTTLQPTIQSSTPSTVPAPSKTTGPSPSGISISSPPDSIPAVSQPAGTSAPSQPGITTNRQGIQFSGKQTADLSLNSREMTALMNEQAWAKLPLNSAQVRFNMDGSTELSGMLVLNDLKDFAAAWNVSSESIDTILSVAGVIAGIDKEVPIYVKSNLGATEGRVSFDVTDLKIGRLPIPSYLINGYKARMTNLLNDSINNIPGFFARSISVVNGELHFNGTLPTTARPL